MQSTYSLCQEKRSIFWEGDKPAVNIHCQVHQKGWQWLLWDMTKTLLELYETVDQLIATCCSSTYPWVLLIKCFHNKCFQAMWQIFRQIPYPKLLNLNTKKIQLLKQQEKSEKKKKKNMKTNTWLRTRFASFRHGTPLAWYSTRTLGRSQKMVVLGAWAATSEFWVIIKLYHTFKQLQKNQPWNQPQPLALKPTRFPVALGTGLTSTMSEGSSPLSDTSALPSFSGGSPAVLGKADVLDPKKCQNWSERFQENNSKIYICFFLCFRDQTLISLPEYNWYVRSNWAS